MRFTALLYIFYVALVVVPAFAFDYSKIDAFVKEGLSEASPYIALFGTALAYRGQFDASVEGTYFEDMFGRGPTLEGPGGTVKAWNMGNNPVFYETTMTGNGRGVAHTLVELNPCGLPQPHNHPRALEFIHVLEGTVCVSFVEEHGGRTITNCLSQGMSTYIPSGLFHSVHNLECAKASFVAFFTNVDPGTVSMLSALLKFPDTTLETCLPGLDAEKVNWLKNSEQPVIPQGPASCLQKCGINYY